MLKYNWYLKKHHHNYYSLVEPYRENGKNRHRIIYYYGQLTDEELQIITQALEVMKKRKATTKIEDIIFENYWQYLNIAFMNSIWNQWDLSKIFMQSKNKIVQTSEIAKILTIYRCLAPGSYISAIEWNKKTALNRILDIDNRHINKSKIFRELDEIENRKIDIENHLYKILNERDADLQFVFYDLTDSYFEGKKRELATPGITKNNGFQKKRIVLSLLVNSKGYPFAWDILDDYTADVNTIKDLSTKWISQFKFNEKEIILVFDRGMVSDENLKHLENEKYVYITALDKNQIPYLKNANIERFKPLNEENMIEHITKIGFKKYDDKTYFENIGIIEGRRYVMIFNPKMFVDEIESHDKLMVRAKAYLDEENKALTDAKNSRNEAKTRNKIDMQLKVLKAKKFVDYDLEPLTIKTDGKEVNSFQIVKKDTEKTKKAIEKARKTYGLWVLVTNNINDEKDMKVLTEERLISAYRDKNQIEDAFKDVKSFIKIQPFNVWTQNHVKAHYTICVLSYLLNITITDQLKKIELDIKSSQKVYSTLQDGIIGKITIQNTGFESLKLIKLKSQQKKIVELFQCETIIDKKYLKSIGINY
ncbi:MAG: IS1634 family transposase [Nanohaloarchaea archaeon]|nr:IS1634 family transposase [Candidatus Nanohaloarchaea archaeon]